MHCLGNLLFSARLIGNLYALYCWNFWICHWNKEAELFLTFWFRKHIQEAKPNCPGLSQGCKNATGCEPGWFLNSCELLSTSINPWTRVKELGLKITNWELFLSKPLCLNFFRGSWIKLARTDHWALNSEVLVQRAWMLRIHEENYFCCQKFSSVK